MDSIDRPTIQRTAAGVAAELKQRPAHTAAAAYVQAFGRSARFTAGLQAESSGKCFFTCYTSGRAARSWLHRVVLPPPEGAEITISSGLPKPAGLSAGFWTFDSGPWACITPRFAPAHGIFPVPP